MPIKVATVIVLVVVAVVVVVVGVVSHRNVTRVGEACENSK